MVSTAASHARVRGSVPGLGGLKETKMFLPHPRVKVSIVGSLRDREVACSASDRQGSNFESCVWRTVSSHSSHHPQEVLLAQFSLYVHKGGLKPDSFHFVDRGLAESVLKPSIGVGTFKKYFFLFDPSLTSGMSAALMQGYCLRRRPCIKQHMSGGREFHRKYQRQLPPHLTRHETSCDRVGLMLSQRRRQWANIKLAFC